MQAFALVGLAERGMALAVAYLVVEAFAVCPWAGAEVDKHWGFPAEVVSVVVSGVDPGVAKQ